MSRYTVKYKSMCSGGGHVTLSVLRDGIAVRDLTLMRSDMLETELSWEDVIPFFLREVIKRSGATTLAQARAAIEAASWEI